MQEALVYKNMTVRPPADCFCCPQAILPGIEEEECCHIQRSGSFSKTSSMSPRVSSELAVSSDQSICTHIQTFYTRCHCSQTPIIQLSSIRLLLQYFFHTNEYDFLELKCRNKNARSLYALNIQVPNFTDKVYFIALESLLASSMTDFCTFIKNLCC